MSSLKETLVEEQAGLLAALLKWADAKGKLPRHEAQVVIKKKLYCSMEDAEVHLRALRACGDIQERGRYITVLAESRPEERVFCARRVLRPLVRVFGAIRRKYGVFMVSPR